MKQPLAVFTFEYVTFESDLHGFKATLSWSGNSVTEEASIEENLGIGDITVKEELFQRCVLSAIYAGATNILFDGIQFVGSITGRRFVTRLTTNLRSQDKFV